MTARVAFLFPGQGSQAVGMGADVFAASPAARRVFETVDVALGFPLSALCFEGPEQILRETINAQPAIITVSLAYLAAFQEALAPHEVPSWSYPLTPAFVAGHSVGEYAALVAAGGLDLADAATLVRERGRLMHAEGIACPGGMSAVIGLDVAAIQDICQEVTAQAGVPVANEHPGQGRVAVANYNAPGQIVISGELQAMRQAEELARARGAKRIIPLSVSGAFHSPVMLPAASGLAQALASARVSAVAIPLISNMRAAPLSTAMELREELAQQIAAPVQWTQSIQYMASADVSVFIEIGPGQALTAMVKRIAKGTTNLNISKMEDIDKVVRLAREMGLSHEI